MPTAADAPIVRNAEGLARTRSHAQPTIGIFLHGLCWAVSTRLARGPATGFQPRRPADACRVGYGRSPLLIALATPHPLLKTAAEPAREARGPRRSRTALRRGPRASRLREPEVVEEDADGGGTRPSARNGRRASRRTRSHAQPTIGVIAPMSTARRRERRPGAHAHAPDTRPRRRAGRRTI